LDLRCFLFATPDVSKEPLTVWYRTPGRSFTLPPRIKTTECSWRLWPSPPIYEVTSYPLVSLTLQTFLKAELGFLGVVVYTRVQTPLRCGDFSKAGTSVFLTLGFEVFLLIDLQ
jgi:hypothetical protein